MGTQRRTCKKLIVVLGPTASGKTKMSIKLAKEFNGEIVSADSRQIYKEMDIGTAKPFQSQKSKLKSQKYKSKSKNNKCRPLIINNIPHYLIDVIYPDQEFNVAIYKKLAIKIIKDIQKRKKLPFLVGGTGLYISAIVDNLKFPGVKPDKKLRKKLEKKSAKELFQIYQKLDPKGANLIEKENKRRLIRAIEVCKITNKPFSQLRKKGKPLFDILQIGIDLPKDILRKRIKRRVEEMIKLGLEEEAKKLIKKYSWDLPSLQTIGYQEWKDYFEGKVSLKEVKEKIFYHTWQYARRQMTWFKRDKRIHWIKNQKEAEKLIEQFLKTSQS
jgi:tRNA dimethylallyltransferase